MRTLRRIDGPRRSIVAARRHAGRNDLEPMRDAGCHSGASVDWADYEPFASGISGPLRDVPREAAVDHYERLMAARPERRRQLEALWRRCGGAADLDGASPDAVGAWLAGALDARGPDAWTGPDADLWTGVVADVALWLGERIIAASGGRLRWELCTAPKKATGYQRPVLAGFTAVPDPRYYVDVAHLVASWAELAARRRPNLRRDFLATIEATTLRDA